MMFSLMGKMFMNIISQMKSDFKAPSLATAVNYEGNEQVAGMLASAPYAIPLPGKYLMEKKIRVSDIPAGLLLNRYSGDLDVRIVNPDLPQGDVPNPRQAGPTTLGQKSQSKSFDPSNLRAIEPKDTPVQRIAKSKQGHENDRVALIRAPRESTNRGKNPSSRNYVRGVLHPHPWSLRLGAFFTLMIMPLLPATFISVFLLLLLSKSPESFPWIPNWLIVFPMALPLVLLGYLIWGFTGKCESAHKGFLPESAHRNTSKLIGSSIWDISCHSAFICYSSVGSGVRLAAHRFV